MTKQLYQKCVDIYIKGVISHPQIVEKERREAIHKLTGLKGREMDDFYNQVSAGVWYQDSLNAPLD